jgi:hypothetical protein
MYEDGERSVYLIDNVQRRFVAKIGELVGVRSPDGFVPLRSESKLFACFALAR